MSEMKVNAAGVKLSLLEKLPAEILEKILSHLTVSRPRTSCMIDEIPVCLTEKSKSSPCLFPCSLTSKKLLASALPILYRYPRFLTTHKLQHFLSRLEDSPILGSWVRSFDLTELDEQISIEDIDRLTRATPLLMDFSLHIHKLESSESWKENLDGIIDSFLPCRHLIRLSLRNFSTFPSLGSDKPELQTSGLGNFHKLQFLDLQNNPIFAQLLETVSPFARLTSLSIAAGNSLSVDLLVLFLTSPSAKRSLQSLRIEALPDRIDEVDTTKIIAALPATLTSLDLGSCPMTKAHTVELQKVAAKLEELTLGPGLTMPNVEDIILDPCWDFSIDDSQPHISSRKHNPPMDATRHAVQVCITRLRLSSVVWTGKRYAAKVSLLRYLGIQHLATWEQTKISSSVLLAKQAVALEIIDVSPKVYLRSEGLKGVCAAVGWKCRGVGDRAWVERNDQVNR